MVKKGNKGNRKPVTVERLQLEQVNVSRVILLEAYLEAWQQPSHVCGVIRDKIREQWLKPTEEAGLRDMHRCFPDYQVWDRSFQCYLQRHQLTREWLRVWRIPVFEGWEVSEQLQLLMKWAEGWQQLSQILVLGYDPGLLVRLPELSRRARGIHFYLDYAPRNMEDIQDWIYEEYGLMTEWHFSEDGTEAAYPGLSQRLRSYPGSCLVIDLTGREDIPMTGLKPGSIWWDLGAMEEKRHRLEDRPLGIQYFSLKTLWRDMPAEVHIDVPSATNT